MSKRSNFLIILILCFVLFCPLASLSGDPKLSESEFLKTLESWETVEHYKNQYGGYALSYPSNLLKIKDKTQGKNAVTWYSLEDTGTISVYSKLGKVRLGADDFYDQYLKNKNDYRVTLNKSTYPNYLLVEGKLYSKQAYFLSKTFFGRRKTVKLVIVYPYVTKVDWNEIKQGFLASFKLTE